MGLRSRKGINPGGDEAKQPPKKRTGWLWAGTVLCWCYMLIFLPSLSSILFALLSILLIPVKAADTLRARVKAVGRTRWIAAVVLLMVASLVAPTGKLGSSSRGQAMEPTTAPTTAATQEASEPTTKPTTAPATEPTTVETTQPPTTEPETEATTEPEPTTQATTEATEPEPTTQATTEATEPEEEMVWIPTKGGSKYHRWPDCSNMDNPAEVTISQAKARGFTPCKRCY